MKIITFICLAVFLTACDKSTADTPYIAEIRERYEINKGLEFVVIFDSASSCAEHLWPSLMFYFLPEDTKKSYDRNQYTDLPCTKNDVKVLRRQAKMGDLFAMAFIGAMNKDKDMVKKAADLSEPASQIILATLFYPSYNSYDNFTLTKPYLQKNASFTAYRTMLDKLIYFDHSDEFCAVVDEAHALHGDGFLDSYAYAKGGIKERLLKCGVELHIDENSPEFFMSVAEEHLKIKQYDEAYKIFYKLNDNVSDIGITAKRCLGFMYYSGKGTKMDRKKGRQMIYEAYHLGMSNLGNRLPAGFERILPQSKKLVLYRDVNCSPERFDWP